MGGVEQAQNERACTPAGTGPSLPTGRFLGQWLAEPLLLVLLLELELPELLLALLLLELLELPEPLPLLAQ